MDSQDKEDLIWIGKILLFSIPVALPFIILFIFESEIISERVISALPVGGCSSWRMYLFKLLRNL